MLIWIRASCLLVLLALTSCANRPTTPAERDAAAAKAAASIAEQWGLAPGLPREVKLRQLLAQLLTEPAVIDALNAKPAAQAYGSWVDQLQTEGLPLLPDDALRRLLAARSRLLAEATDAECSAFIQMSLPGKSAATSAGIWRQRLARVSEPDFDDLNVGQIEAIRLRANHLTEPAFALTRGQETLAEYAIEAQMTVSDKEAFRRISKKDGDGAALDPMDACTMLRIIFKAQAEVAGPNADIGLRWNALWKQR